jgi:hypothetical protein
MFVGSDVGSPNLQCTLQYGATHQHMQSASKLAIYTHVSSHPLATACHVANALRSGGSFNVWVRAACRLLAAACRRLLVQ